MLLKIEPLRPFNSSWYPYAGKLGLTPVAFAGSVRLRQESPYDPALDVSSVVIRVICSHGLHGSRATIFQASHTLHTLPAPAPLAHADLPFRIVIPPLVDAPGILSLGAYGVAWHIDALVYGPKNIVLLNRSIRLQLDRYAPRPHALPPVSTSPPCAPLPNGQRLNVRLSRSIYCATDSITATLHLNNPCPDALLLRLHVKLIRRISVRPDTSSPKIQDSRSFASFKSKHVPLPARVSLRIPPPANRYRYSVGESSRTEYAHIEFYLSIKATVKLPGSSSPISVQIEPVPFTLLSVDRQSLDAAKHHAKRYYLAQSPEIKNICNAPRSINHISYPDSSSRGDLNHYSSDDYRVPEFLSEEEELTFPSGDSSSIAKPLHLINASTDSVSDHSLDIFKKLRPTTASTITQANYRHKNPRHTMSTPSTPSVSSPLSPHHPMTSPTSNTFSDKSSMSGLTSSSVPPSPASTTSSLDNTSSSSSHRPTLNRYPHLPPSISDIYASSGSGSGSEDDMSDGRRSKLKSHVSRLVHSRSTKPLPEASPYKRVDVDSSDLLVLAPSHENGSHNGSQTQEKDLGETLSQKNSSRSSLLGALNIARWSRTKLASDIENDTLCSSTSLPVSLTMDSPSLSPMSPSLTSPSLTPPPPYPPRVPASKSSLSIVKKTKSRWFSVGLGRKAPCHQVEV